MAKAVTPTDLRRIRAPDTDIAQGKKHEGTQVFLTLACFGKLKQIAEWKSTLELLDAMPLQG